MRIFTKKKYFLEYSKKCFCSKSTYLSTQKSTSLNKSNFLRTQKSTITQKSTFSQKSTCNQKVLLIKKKYFFEVKKKLVVKKYKIFLVYIYDFLQDEIIIITIVYFRHFQKSKIDSKSSIIKAIKVQFNYYSNFFFWSDLNKIGKFYFLSL